MTDEDRKAITEVLARIYEEGSRQRYWNDLADVRYWLERLDEDAQETVCEFFGEVVTQPSHQHWDLAVDVLSWLGWPDPSRNAEFLARSLNLYPTSTQRHDTLLCALLRLGHRPVLPLVEQRITACEHRGCECHHLIPWLAYLDPSASVAFGAELLDRIPDYRESGDYRVEKFFTTYGQRDPTLLQGLVDELFKRNPQQGRLVAICFAKWLTWFGTWGTNEARRPLRDWMVKRAGLEKPPVVLDNLGRPLPDL